MEKKDAHEVTANDSELAVSSRHDDLGETFSLCTTENVSGRTRCESRGSRVDSELGIYIHRCMHAYIANETNIWSVFEPRCYAFSDA